MNQNFTAFKTIVRREVARERRREKRTAQKKLPLAGDPACN